MINKLFCALMALMLWPASARAQADPMLNTPLTFEAAVAGATVSFRLTPDAPNIYYSKDGTNWILFNYGYNDEHTISIQLNNVGDKVAFRGDNPAYGSASEESSCHISCTEDCYVYGNIMSLISTSYTNLIRFEGGTNKNFSYLFYNNEHLLSHPTKDLVLPATRLSNSCYKGMFYHCTKLARAPELPTTEFEQADNCYESMFEGCTSLIKAPVLPAINLNNDCYKRMFYGCSNLSYVDCYAPSYYYIYMYDTYMQNWLYDVSATGVFINHTPNDDISSYVPAGWTILDYHEVNNSWSNLKGYMEQNSYIKLTGNCTAGGSDTYLNVPSGKTVELDLNGYIINRGLDDLSTNGHVILIESGGTLTIKDDSNSGEGKIKGGKCSSHGGGIYNAGTLIIQSGSIKENRTYQYGGGIYNTGSLTISGGNITGNSSSSDSGGGIYNSGTLEISGLITINNNTSGVNPNNVYLCSEKIITISSSLDSDTRIGITAANSPRVFTSGLSGKGNASNFTSDNNSYIVTLYNDEAQLSNVVVVASAVITGIDTPEAATDLDDDATCSTTGVESNSVAWKTGETDATSATAGNEYTVYVTLTPSNGYAFTNNTTATINGNTANVSLNNNGQLTASYTFPATEKRSVDWNTSPTASPIIYGQALSSSTLDGGSASVAGSFAWTDPDLKPTATSDYSVTFTPTDATNYNSISHDVNLIVNKKALTITAKDQTFTYGGSITTGPSQVITEGLVNGDYLSEISLSTSGYNYTTDGTITPSNAKIYNGGYVTNRYNINYVQGKLTINKKDLAITAEAKSKEYGEADPTLTYTYEGLEGSDAITGSLTRAAGEDYGTYAISQGSLTAGDNYNISYTEANFTINKATLTVTADDKSKTYGDANPPFTVSISGFKKSENSNVLTSQPTAACSATVASGVGNYTITPSGGEATNYSFSYTNGKLTVGAKTLTDEMVAISNNSKVYTGENQKPTVTITDNAANITESDYTITNNGGTNVGNYSVSVVAKGNYTGTVTKTNCFNISAYDISNAGLTITAIDDQTYTGSAITPTTTVTATNINKVVTADYGYSANINVGTVNVTLTGTGNYTGTKTNATTFQIVPKALEDGMIEAIADQTYTGDDIEPDLTVTHNTMPLTKGTHYTAAFFNNTNTTDAPTVTITACDGSNYSGTASANFSIVQANLNTATVNGSSKTVDYDGTTSPAIDPLTVNFPVADYTIKYRKTYETPVTDVAAIPTNAIGEYTVVLKPTDNGNLTGEKVTSYTVNVQLPVSLKQSEWTTYYDERFDLATPAGYQAYKVSAASASSVTAEAIGYIPQGVPVILKTTESGTSSNSMTVKFNESRTTPAISGNDAAFIGVPSTSAGVTPAGTNFILVGDKFVLYEGTDAIPAHRCYLNFVGSPSRSIEIVFGDEETTGLSAPPKPTLQEEQERWYDIQGRRIEKPTKKGMYIKDGQKVVITGKEGWL